MGLTVQMAACVSYGKTDPTESDMILKRVKMAALAMQRYNWEQGVLAQAFLEAGEHETAILMAVEGMNRQLPDGRCAQIGEPGAATDPCAIGEALIFACEQTGDPALCLARDALLDWALHRAPRNADGLIYHFVHNKVFWVDSMYMLPPFLARAGFVDEALKQLDGWWAALWDAEKGLLSHQWNDETQRFDRREAWGVGNGWALAGLARLIGLMPVADPRRESLIGRAQGLIDHMLPLLRPDGLFHDVLDAPATFPEINAGQMLAYTIFRGIAEGWLEKSYLPAAQRIRQAAHVCVDAYGLVRPVCGMPTFDKPGVATEGQAFFILMESAAARCGLD